MRGLEVTTDALYNLLMEINELRQEIEDLKARITALEAERDRSAQP